MNGADLVDLHPCVKDGLALSANRGKTGLFINVRHTERSHRSCQAAGHGHRSVETAQAGFHGGQNGRLEFGHRQSSTQGLETMRVTAGAVLGHQIDVGIRRK